VVCAHRQIRVSWDGPDDDSDLMASSQFHIAHGGSGAESLRLFLGCDPGAVLVQHDPLSVGPLPRVEHLDDWNTVRGAFWKGVLGAVPPEPLEWDLPTNVQALRGCQSVCAWVGTGASDQLLLPWVVELFRLVNLPLPDLSVVRFDQLPGCQRPVEVIGLGMLSPENIGTHAPAEVVCREGIAELQGVWAALTNPQPSEILRTIEEGPGRFPLLHRALQTGLDHFPDSGSGLSHWDFELLKHTRSSGPVARRIVGNTLSAAYDVNYPESVGDFYLFDRLRRLGDAGLPQPAVQLEAGEQPSFWGWQVRLTDAGERFLQAQQNFVELNGIDEWVAGVHLDSRAGRVWFREGTTLLAATAG
jgi:Domain of unknown function (DUF1835)